MYLIHIKWILIQYSSILIHPFCYYFINTYFYKLINAAL